MTVTVGTSGGNKVASAIYVGTSGGNKAVLQGYVGTAGGNKLVFAALTATASPSSLSVSAGGFSPITTGATTATPVGGVGPFTYVWTIDNINISITTDSAASTTFSASPTSGNTENGSASCLVTDTVSGATATTNSVSVAITRT